MNLVWWKTLSDRWDIFFFFFFFRLGFEIPDADYDKLYTIQAVVDYLMKKMNINPTA